MPEASWRLFVGCFLHSEELLAAYAQLRSACSAYCRAKWVEPENLHFTFAFLGDFPRRRIPELLTALSPVLHSYASLLTLRGVGVFPHRASPRVLYIGIENPDRQLWSVHEHIGHIVSSFGISVEQSRFVPHVTIARLKQVTAPQLFQQFLASHREDIFGHFESFQPVLVRSILTAERPLYHVLSPDAPLPE